MNEKCPEEIQKEDEAECIAVHVFEDEPEDNGKELEESVIEEIRSRKAQSTESVQKPKKLSDIWYHYKLPIIVAICSLIVIIYITVASLPGKYDVTAALYVSYTDYAATVTGDVRDELGKYALDWDENGEIAIGISDYNVAAKNEETAIANSTILMEHLSGEPSAMLWIMDYELYSVIVYSYGEEIFESYEGAPGWIEITWSSELNERIENGECPPLGICLRSLDRELSKNEKLCTSYENAKLLLNRIMKAHPDAFSTEGK